MALSGIKFNLEDRPEFFPELRKRVNAYFKDNDISKHANANMRIKTGFMLCLYFVPYGLMMSGAVSSFWGVMLIWVLMGLGMSGIGLSIMHDANHGSYSKSHKVNKRLGNLISFVGGYRPNWRIQHNVLHHSYTNIEDHDEDIGPGVLRLSPSQKRRPHHRFQVFYGPFLYGLMTLSWYLQKDFDQLYRYHKMGLLKDQGLTYGKAMAQLIASKVLYGILFIALPLIFVDLPWWQILLGFFTMQFLCGLILAMIFSPAHVIEDVEFYNVDDGGSIENNWAIHQMKTTANFANRSRWFSWFIGGLNFQIEHHLFPNICHVHYRKISKIVKETAAEYGVPYHHYKTFLGAVKSHLVVLNQLGKGRTELAA